MSKVVNVLITARIKKIVVLIIAITIVMACKLYPTRYNIFFGNNLYKKRDVGVNYKSFTVDINPKTISFKAKKIGLNKFIGEINDTKLYLKDIVSGNDLLCINFYYENKWHLKGKAFRLNKANFQTFTWNEKKEYIAYAINIFEEDDEFQIYISRDNFYKAKKINIVINCGGGENYKLGF